jgi:D-serine deaminase-like pyridoxal phosphate-dependent protein
MTEDWRGPNAELIGRPGSRALLSTPALVLDLDRLDANIRSMASHAESRGHQLRPSVKIHKSVEIARRQVDAGAVGVCCATLAEAEAMVAGGVPGVMLFTSVVSQPKLRRLATLNERATDLIVVVDDLDNVAELASGARETGRRLQVMVDFEVGGGRTGVADEGAAVTLARRIEETDGLEFVGVQAYNGVDLRSADYETRRAAVRRRARQISQLLARLEAEELHPRIVSGGGTGSHDIEQEAGVLTEIQVGTYVFMDANYMNRTLRRDEPQPFEPALTVRATVVSAAQPGFVITDAGAKEIDGYRGPISPLVLAGAPESSQYSIVGDDLGRIDFADESAGLRVGAAVELMPPHAFMTVPLYSVYHCVSGDQLVDIWPIQAVPHW